MVNKFGKFLRKLRIDRDMTMRQMAEDLSISTAYLSAMETGIKNINKLTVSGIITIYNLTDEEAEELRNCACISNGSIKIILEDMDNADRDELLLLILKYPKLSVMTKNKIRGLLNNEE